MHSGDSTPRPSQAKGNSDGPSSFSLNSLLKPLQNAMDSASKTIESGCCSPAPPPRVSPR